MSITKNEFSRHIKSFQFRELFNDMGWNNDRTNQPIIINEETFNLTGIAEKSGFRIFICEPSSGNKIPDSVTRKKIESKLTKLFQEHLIIFIDSRKKDQIWQLAVRKAGSPTKISETRYNVEQQPELLYQRASGLFFTLDEEEKVTIIDVTKRVADNFQKNNERVTKKFYESFKKEHTAFLKFIKGIDDQMSMDWYASLMLNRLMFCYFIQKKGFLDNNKNYLHDKLKVCKEQQGKNEFYSFYRNFLLALFHKGLGAPVHDKKLEVEIGRIPYLNGGLFDEHEIEKTFSRIEIDDKAFEKLFDFFDQYEWHLDTRESASGKEINPDVIGYIFEKYINDRAQMGAYYTKEDITDYISKNCIIPWLFDEVKRQYVRAGSKPAHKISPFADGGWLWQMVKASGDDYIYDAVKYGVPALGLERAGLEPAPTMQQSMCSVSVGADSKPAPSTDTELFNDLPPEILKGFNPELEKKVVSGNGEYLWEIRKSWNKPAPSDIALPTEIYREVIERRKRYAEIKSKITNGEVKEINDFITCNLNIRQFAQDVIETTEDAEFVRYFYKALTSITILDPTCGSGAFLFAALGILEPLYEACIKRMRDFVDENGKGKHKFFEETLKQVTAPEHPNLQYFIYKSIILNNLYGVDIMNEAVEIAKLRLFLKLVATVDADYRKPNLGLEPLPDVDFNIRAGNTLVGYATEKQLEDSLNSDLIARLELPAIKEKCDIVGLAFTRYKEIQLKGNADFEDFKKAKDDLNERLHKIRNELDTLLHKQHYDNIKFCPWLATHQPFHWFAEFYEIMQGKGGFDVIIGNPPYVESKKINYRLLQYSTFECGNLYAFIMERSFIVKHDQGYCGMIVPMSGHSTDRMELLIHHFYDKATTLHLMNISADAHPSVLFPGVKFRLAIFLHSNVAHKKMIFTTKYNRWYAEARDNLFYNLEYTDAPFKLNSVLPKIISPTHRMVLQKLRNHKGGIAIHKGSHAAYFHNAPVNWIRAHSFIPYFVSERDGEKASTQLKSLTFAKQEQALACSGVLCSTLFFIWWLTTSDCYHLNRKEIDNFLIDLSDLGLVKQLASIAQKLNNDMQSKSKRRVYVYETSGRVEYDEFYLKLSKSIIDQIDTLLAQHYGFTHEELDFIINYDIKYRMGKELNGGEAEDEE